MTRRVWVVGLALGCLLALPAAARAQSSIGGTVKDTSGAVLPGVTVEISSPTMIEGSKETTTDGSGAYRIVDLRPGMYSVKFSLTGFATVERSAFQLLSDFNARIDAEMKVGALEETITVTGAAPIVDVQSAAKIAVLDRDAIDNIPTGKTIQGLGQLILGVSLNAPDVGGSAGAMQTYMSLHGTTVSAANNTVMVDGMVINGLMLDGAVQTYTNDADFQEMTYQTAGIDASRSGGGVTLNMVPKEGGNRFSGAGSGLYRPDYLQAQNYSQRFITWGLPKDKNGEPAINRIKRITDFNVSEGGPIMKDKLWFFVSGRDFQPVNTVPNTFLDDGTQGIDDNYIRNSLVRLTYQLSPKNKLGAYYERVFKWRGHDMSAFNDPETVALIWTSPNYNTFQVKYTGTLSSKLLVEGGFSQNTEYYRNLLQPSVDFARGSAAWYDNAQHTATGGAVGVAAAGSVQQFPVSKVWQGSMSYVTGAHHAKAGLSFKNGKFLHGGDGNADLSQGYPTFNRVASENYNIYFPQSDLSDARFNELFPGLNGVRPCALGTPTATVASQSQCTATIRNSPRAYQENLNADGGVFVQDSYTMKRLTLNAGVRYEWFNSEVAETTSPAGRWVPNRVTSADKLANGGKDIPNWKDWAPRFQAVYDLRGDSRTAIKYSLNRYNEAVTTSVASGFNPIALTTSSRNWTDLNGDDIAQGEVTYDAAGNRIYCTYLQPGCEINNSGLAGVTQTALDPNYGLLSAPGTYTQFPRRYRIEQGVEIQHALLPRLSLNGTYYHGENKNFTKTVNWNRKDVATGGQYAPVTVFNPIDGTPYLYYNAIATIASDNHTDVDHNITQSYDSYTAEFRMRPYAGAQLTGGIDFERTLNKNCGTTQVKADGTPAVVDPNTLRFCDDRNLVAFSGGPVIGKPFTKDFKLSGAFPLKYGVNFGVSYQNIDSGTVNPSFRYGTSFKYPDGTNAYTSLTSSTPLAACPTTYGCVPGGQTVAANLSGGAAGTSIGNQNAVAFGDERIAQLDLKASKNFRFGKISVQPAFEAFNVLNVDSVRSRLSTEYAVAAGNYLTPNNMLQGRILGFGANVKW